MATPGAFAGFGLAIKMTYDSLPITHFQSHVDAVLARNQLIMAKDEESKAMLHYVTEQPFDVHVAKMMLLSLNITEDNHLEYCSQVQSDTFPLKSLNDLFNVVPHNEIIHTGRSVTIDWELPELPVDPSKIVATYPQSIKSLFEAAKMRKIKRQTFHHLVPMDDTIQAVVPNDVFIDVMRVLQCRYTNPWIQMVNHFLLIWYALPRVFHFNGAFHYFLPMHDPGALSAIQGFVRRYGYIKYTHKGEILLGDNAVEQLRKADDIPYDKLNLLNTSCSDALCGLVNALCVECTSDVLPPKPAYEISFLNAAGGCTWGEFITSRFIMLILPCLHPESGSAVKDVQSYMKMLCGKENQGLCIRWSSSGLDTFSIQRAVTVETEETVLIQDLKLAINDKVSKDGFLDSAVTEGVTQRKVFAEAIDVMCAYLPQLNQAHMRKFIAICQKVSLGDVVAPSIYYLHSEKNCRPFNRSTNYPSEVDRLKPSNTHQPERRICPTTGLDLEELVKPKVREWLARKPLNTISVFERMRAMATGATPGSVGSQAYKINVFKSALGSKDSHKVRQDAWRRLSDFLKRNFLRCRQQVVYKLQISPDMLTHFSHVLFKIGIPWQQAQEITGIDYIEVMLKRLSQMVASPQKRSEMIKNTLSLLEYYHNTWGVCAICVDFDVLRVTLNIPPSVDLAEVDVCPAGDMLPVTVVTPDDRLIIQFLGTNRIVGRKSNSLEWLRQSLSAREATAQVDEIPDMEPDEQAVAVVSSSKTRKDKKQKRKGRHKGKQTTRLNVKSIIKKLATDVAQAEHLEDPPGAAGFEVVARNSKGMRVKRKQTPEEKAAQEAMRVDYIHSSVEDPSASDYAHLARAACLEKSVKSKALGTIAFLANGIIKDIEDRAATLKRDTPQRPTRAVYHVPANLSLVQMAGPTHQILVKSLEYDADCVHSIKGGKTMPGMGKILHSTGHGGYFHASLDVSEQDKSVPELQMAIMVIEVLMESLKVQENLHGVIDGVQEEAVKAALGWALAPMGQAYKVTPLQATHIAMLTHCQMGRVEYLSDGNVAMYKDMNPSGAPDTSFMSTLASHVLEFMWSYWYTKLMQSSKRWYRLLMGDDMLSTHEWTDPVRKDQITKLINGLPVIFKAIAMSANMSKQEVGFRSATLISRHFEYGCMLSYLKNFVDQERATLPDLDTQMTIISDCLQIGCLRGADPVKAHIRALGQAYMVTSTVTFLSGSHPFKEDWGDLDVDATKALAERSKSQANHEVRRSKGQCAMLYVDRGLGGGGQAVNGFLDGSSRGIYVRTDQRPDDTDAYYVKALSTHLSKSSMITGRASSGVCLTDVLEMGPALIYQAEVMSQDPVASKKCDTSYVAHDQLYKTFRVRIPPQFQYPTRMWSRADTLVAQQCATEDDIMDKKRSIAMTFNTFPEPTEVPEESESEIKLLRAWNEHVAHAKAYENERSEWTAIGHAMVGGPFIHTPKKYHNCEGLIILTCGPVVHPVSKTDYDFSDLPWFMNTGQRPFDPIINLHPTAKLMCRSYIPSCKEDSEGSLAYKAYNDYTKLAQEGNPEGFKFLLSLGSKFRDAASKEKVLHLALNVITGKDSGKVRQLAKLLVKIGLTPADHELYASVASNPSLSQQYGCNSELVRDSVKHFVLDPENRWRPMEYLPLCKSLSEQMFYTQQLGVVPCRLVFFWPYATFRKAFT